MPQADSSQLTDGAIIEQVKKQSAYKQTSGDRLVEQLGTLNRLLGVPLAEILLQPGETHWKLLRHFRSPLALKQHAQAAVTALKYLCKRFPCELHAEWQGILDDATAKASRAQQEVHALLTGLKDAMPKTILGYVNGLMNMTALLNAGSVLEVLADPSRFRIQLSTLCNSPYTESTYISRILSVFKANPELKEKHRAAHEVWQCASSEHRAQHLRIAKQNAPTNARQAANFASMDDWRQCLARLQAEPDPHATLQQSMALCFMAYACTVPPKRAEVGTLRIFKTTPSAAEQAAAPNRIVLSDAVMHIGKHKTSKHAVHAAGITEALPDEFMGVVQASLTRWPRCHLFVDGSGKAYDAPAFSKWLIRTTGSLFGGAKAPGVSLLRHGFCSALDYNRLTGAQREELALRLGHKAETQDRYRYLTLTHVALVTQGLARAMPAA